MDIEYVRSRFIKHFDGTTGSVYASPGRINLIGEHTDYNGGFVFPGAVDKMCIRDRIRSDVFIVFHHLVNDTIRCQFNNTVRHRFNKFVVVGREQHLSLIHI